LESKALALAEKGSTFAATSLNALNFALTSTSKAAIGMRASFMAFLVVAAAVTLNAMNRAKAEEEVQNAYQARFTEAGRNTKDGEKGPAYVGPGTDAYLKQQEDMQSNTTGYLAAFSDIVGLAYKYFTPMVFATVGKNIGDALTGDQAAKNGGDISGTKYEKDLNGKFGAGAITNLRKVAALPGATSRTLQDAQKILSDGMDAMAKEVAADTTLEPLQKANILAQLENTTKYAQEASNSLMAGLQGISKVNRLLSDQIKKIDQYVSTMQTVVQSGGADMSSWVDGLSAVIEDIGLQEGNNLLPLLRSMKSGQTDKIDFARMQLEVLKSEVDSTEASMMSAISSGMLEPEQIEALVTDFQAKVAAYAQQELTVFETRMQAYSDRATLAARGGDPGRAPLKRYQSKIDVLMSKRAAIQAEKRQVQNGPREMMAKMEQELLDIEDQRQTILTGWRGNPDAGIGKAGIGYAQRAAAQLAALETRRKSTEQSLADLRANPNGNATEIARLEVLEAAETDAIIAANTEYNKWVDSYARAKTRNAVEIAKIDEGTAKKNYDYIMSLPKGGPGGSTAAQRRQARIDLINARNVTNDSTFAEQAAARQTGIASIQPGNAVAIANATLNDANAALANAQQYKRTSTQYQSAMQQVIRARQAYTDAVANVVAADAALGIAVANAAGRTVKAAQLQADEAKRKYAVALAHGGAGSAEAINAQADIVNQNAALRDAKFNDAMGTVDFNMEMGRMTKSAAITALRNILKASDLTREERRQVLLKIKGLTNELNDGQWNLGDIKVPTPYDMRRYIASNLPADAAAAALGYSPGDGSFVNAKVPPKGYAQGSQPSDYQTEYNYDPYGVGYANSRAAVRSGRKVDQNANGQAKGSDGAALGQTLTIYIDGTDVGMVKEVLRKEYGDQIMATSGSSNGKY
jgi:hypothetical protein